MEYHRGKTWRIWSGQGISYVPAIDGDNARAAERRAGVLVAWLSEQFEGICVRYDGSGVWRFVAETDGVFH